MKTARCVLPRLARAARAQNFSQRGFLETTGLCFSADRAQR